MKTFLFPTGSIQIDKDGDIWIFQTDDSDRILIERSSFREFFEAIDAARDEAFPPGPLKIPDPVRHDELRAKVEALTSEPRDPHEIRAALARLTFVIANEIVPGAQVAS